VKRAHSISGLALAGTLGVLLLVGCGGASHAADTTTAASTAKAAPSIGTQTTTANATRTATTTTASSTAHIHKSASGGSRSNAPNAYDGVPFAVRTASMTPTYQPETTVYYDPTRTQPQIGDVIVFLLPKGGLSGECGSGDVDGSPCLYPAPGLTKKLDIKRVVGLPGDTLTIRDGRVTRNGRPEAGVPTIPCKAGEAGCEFSKAFVVPAGHYYVMSDDRQLFEEDSRVWGAVPQEAIVGTVVGS
jgi:signal peptidase I